MPKPETLAQLVRHLSLMLSKPRAPQLSSEALLFDRFLYKNANQHKTAKYFKMATRVKKLLARLQRSELEKCVRAVLGAMAVKNPKSYKPSDSDVLPDISLLTSLLDAIKTHHVLLKLTVCSTRAAYCSFKVVAAQTYFVPLMLTFMAVLSRIHQIALSIMKDLQDSYEALHRIASKDIPQPKKMKGVASKAVDSGIKLSDLSPLLSSDLEDVYQTEESMDLFDSQFVPSMSSLPLTEVPLIRTPAESLAPELDIFFTSMESTSKPKSNATGKKRAIEAEDIPSVSSIEPGTKKAKTDGHASAIDAKSERMANDSLVASKSKSKSSVVMPKNKKFAKPKKKGLSANEIDAIFGL
ncbi:hypothetical protein HDU98_000074 [Podochytrium sp. JEL0797]|nr:hypothetical protein HDU98_000074 [Podochytrium sp. JEL0797]